MDDMCAGEPPYDDDIEFFLSSNHVSAVLDSAILTDYFNSVMKSRILEGGPWTTCMLVSLPMMTTLSMIKLLINNNSWIFVNFSLNESEIRLISEKLTRHILTRTLKCLSSKT